MYHYNVNGQQAGPVSEEQLRQMVAGGTLSPATLVWKEGMAEWQPVTAVLPGLTSAPVQCSVCGQMFPVDQTIQISGQTVCAGCKPTFVQGLREGAAQPGRNQFLYNVARRQRQVVMCFLALMICNLGGAAISVAVPIAAPLFTLGSIAAMLFCIVYVYKLAKALDYTAIIYAIAMIIPCINLLTLLVLISRATKVLRENGVKVGFLGVSRQTIEQLRDH